MACRASRSSHRSRSKASSISCGCECPAGEIRPSRGAAYYRSAPGRNRCQVRATRTREAPMSNRTFHALAIALAGSLCAVTLAVAEPKLPSLRHVAGPPAAEDLLTIPGTRWVLVSAVSVGAETAPGIYAV